MSLCFIMVWDRNEYIISNDSEFQNMLMMNPISVYFSRSLHFFSLSPPLLFIRFFLFYDKIQNILLHMRLFGWIELMSNIKWNEQVHPTWNTN